MKNRIIWITDSYCSAIQAMTWKTDLVHFSDLKTFVFQITVNNKEIKGSVGHRSIVDKSSAYSAKGPGFKTQWGKKIYLCHCVFICSVEKIVINKRAPIGANLKKNKKKGLMKALISDLKSVIQDMTWIPNYYWVSE